MAEVKVDPKNIKGTDALILLALWLVTSPIAAIVTAMIAAKLWDLLLATQFGPGPTYQTWYGLSLLFQWFTHNISRDDMTKDVEQSWVMWAVNGYIRNLMYGGLLLVGAGLARVVFGWH